MNSSHSLGRSVRWFSALWLGGLCLLPLPREGSACGPFFPNMLLVGGDEPLLVAPIASFQTELDRMKSRPARFKAVIATNSLSTQTIDGDLEDLRTALNLEKRPPAEVAEILRTYQEARNKLQAYTDAFDAWTATTSIAPAGTTLAPPPFPALPAVQTLPAEFAAYWQGAQAWHQQKTNDARAAWMRLLDLPKAQRPFKSTWAAFMLGRSFDDTDPDRAVLRYRQVRELAQAGFADSIGLAAASIGWEARVELRRSHYRQAILLYLDQLASGDSSAYVSLRWTASTALQDARAPLNELAGDPECRRVITAHILSGGFDLAPIDVDSAAKEAALNLAAKTPSIGPKTAAMHTFQQPALAWLEAVEKAGVKDVESAEQFALAAYQSGNMEIARRWVERSWTSPLSQWLQAKLNLRDGQLNKAAALLARICRTFPEATSAGTATSPDLLAQRVQVRNEGYYPNISVAKQALGELGVLHLARREYMEALDCLFRAGFWKDAAYIAERVLTVDELKAYVNRHWPESIARVDSDAPREQGPDPKALRDLLARKMARQHRAEEASKLFSNDSQKHFETYQQLLLTGSSTHLPPAQRASALWTAARMAREHGMELFGTEVEPDWGVHGGNFEYGPSVLARATSRNVARASADEVQRAGQQPPVPDKRFHYRYLAADIAWEAAKLMPDDTDETARVLHTAGTWLKARDPKAADRFYKALVRRCRNTALGQEADRRRWFPELDVNGNIIPKPKPPVEN